MALDQLSEKNNLVKIQERFSKFVVKPLNAFGLGGFVFDIDGEAKNRLEADITDHYVEDNSAIQDHVAKKPIEVTLNNYVGELVRTEIDSFQRDSQKVVQKLTTIAAYAPALISSAETIKDFAAGENLEFDSLLEEGVDLWTLTKNLNPYATKQQRAYLFFKALFEQNILMGLQTPWEFLPRMVIKTIVATQGEDSAYITDFSITLKQIRTASTVTDPFDKSKYQARIKQQAQSVTKKGKSTGKKKSLASTLLGAF